MSIYVQLDGRELRYWKNARLSRLNFMFKGFVCFFFLPKSFIKPLSLKVWRCYLLLVTIEENEQVPILYLVNLYWGRFFSLEKCIKFPPLKEKSYSNRPRGKFSSFHLGSLLNSKAEIFFFLNQVIQNYLSSTRWFVTLVSESWSLVSWTAKFCLCKGKRLFSIFYAE